MPVLAPTSACDEVPLRAVMALRARRRPPTGRPWEEDARPEQLPPPGPWITWLIQAGRGWGKTRTGAEFVKTEIMAGRRRRVALVGSTAADARDVMVEGESGLLACCERAGFRAVYEPSKRKVTFANGAIAHTFSADEPDRLRGPQMDLAWSDEIGAWKYGDQAWANLQFGLRLKGPLGDPPRQVATTTPRPIPLIRRLIRLHRDGDPAIALTRGSSYDNLANLADNYRGIIAGYAGTRLGRQEIMGELLEDIEGALWTHAAIDAARIPPAAFAGLSMARTVVAVDPQAGDGDEGSETGIMVCAKDHCGHAYVIADRSGRFHPAEWGRVAVAAYHEFAADRVVVETNQGGAMAIHTLRTVERNLPIREVRASKGKLTRAEPVAALYEQGRVHHVDLFPQLEDQLTSYVADGRQASPDRLDALVWGLTDLMLTGRAATTEGLDFSGLEQANPWA